MTSRGRKTPDQLLESGFVPPKRKAVPKKVRFEVFKRDMFTCQYCGAKSPDVLLELDHVNPVANGGNNDPMNLLTACQSCNSGKGKRLLNDQTMLEKQRRQLEELSERRAQVKMMLDWRQEIERLEDEQIVALNDVVTRKWNIAITPAGCRTVRQWLKKHSLQEILDALDASDNQYYDAGQIDDEGHNPTIQTAWNMIIRIAAARKRDASKPYMKDLFYIRKIVKNRIFCREKEAIDLLERAYLAGVTIENLKDWAKEAPNWDHWSGWMVEWIDMAGGGE